MVDIKWKRDGGAFLGGGGDSLALIKARREPNF
jgi:hypothetical protein